MRRRRRCPRAPAPPARAQFVGASKVLRHEESATGSRVVNASAETLEGAAVARAFRQQGLLMGRLRAQLAEHVVWQDGLLQVRGLRPGVPLAR